MRNYDFLIIIDAAAAADHLAHVTERITRIITTAGGEVTRSEEVGNRKLAYIIKKQTSGFYLVLGISIESIRANEIAEKIRLDPEVIRCQTAEGISLSLHEQVPVMAEARTTIASTETVRNVPTVPSPAPVSVTIEELEKKVEEMLEQPTLLFRL